ncbi:hypothetical protein MPSEU_000858600 [Mayamaea pseudoterrestris]|nr:hypothetical protein MPSEU_000858600 [Mayamaea pseudoterrestris]
MTSTANGNSSSNGNKSFVIFSKGLIAVFLLSLLSLMVTSSYNRLLSTSMLMPQTLHQQSHSTMNELGQVTTQDSVNSSVVLLLSFPNSGTSYTLANTQTISNLTVATSYDQEVLYDGPPRFVGAYEQSPYILNVSLHQPRSILTKTHCIGHCEICVPEINVQTFQTECLTLTKYNPMTNRNIRTPYHTLPAKSVHLLRNPHDNLVARMHMGVERRRVKLGWAEADLAKFSFDETGFHEWCSYMDVSFKGDLKRMLTEEFGVSQEIVNKLPCLAEWWRYVQWHNNAIAMTKRNNIPTHILYYEEYSNNYQKTVDDLFDFIGLEQVLSPEPFISNKTYDSYYTAETKQLAAELVKQLASPDCWSIIKKYFGENEKESETDETLDVETSVDVVPSTKVSNDLPVVALLVSFPNSGTSYTLKNTMITSNMSVATNYEQEVKNTRIPLRPDLIRSPYVLKPAFDVPHFVLTKTHCSGYCENCSPTDLDEFEYHCLVRTRTVTPGKAYERLPYPRDLVKKTIHLFRDPFDNLVARMHLGIDRRRVVKKWTEEQLSVFTNTPKGMKAWCQEVDGVFRGDFDEVMQNMSVPTNLYEDLPCSTDWYRYVMWHNRAIELIKQWNVPNHVIFYEDYTRRYNETVSGILSFLELEPVHRNYPFYSGKTYRGLYDVETGRKAAAFVERIASPECWQLIRHYFEMYIDTQADSRRKVAWLLSYPNSGTSYTILNTEQMTNASTATNHGQEAPERIPLRPDVSKGPFVHRPSMTLPQLVLTKTHCTGFNFQEPPVTSLDAFKSKCLTATWSEAGSGLAKATYDEQIVRKAVHLIRSPWDNMVSRMHHAIKNAGKLNLSKQFIASITSDDARANLKNWCEYVDNLLPSNLRAQLRSESGDIAKVPCHTDLMRYVGWHNMALEMTDSMAIPVHVLHYDQYSTGYNVTVNELYSFLEQTVQRPPILFKEGKSYSDHFDSESLTSASNLLLKLASKMTLSLIRRYLHASTSIEPVPYPRQMRKLAYLLSFPNSGTSYTITNIQRISNTSAATNYVSATQPGTITPVRPDLTNGPYLLKEERQVPKYVLTKTHCAGYCDGCALHSFLNTVHSFELGCREAHGRDNKDRRRYLEKPAKAVHLFRDVFDNLVARKHLGVELRAAQDKSVETSRMIEDSRQGLLAWCSYVDEVSARDGGLDTFLEPEQLALARNLPCAFELFRYVQWHNLALEMTDRLKIPVHYVYYENYTSNFEETVQGLVDFLDVPMVEPAIDFENGKTYGHLFGDDIARKMALFVRSLATDKCWHHISQYLNKWINYHVEENDSRRPQELSKPKIAWLLSFPNSGTSFTLKNTMMVTGTSVATNYANEVKDRTITMRPDLEHSPFLIDSRLRTETMVLTKSHCNPKDDYDLFRDGCRTLRTTADSEAPDDLYSTSLVVKAVHLIRDPMDNIVARMHHGIRNRAEKALLDTNLHNITDPKALFRPWCRYLDKKFSGFGRDKGWITKAASTLFSQVPCYTDVLHYVVWHNLALQVLEQESIPSYHLYYEDYTADFQRSTLRLYTEFLNLPMTGEPAKFIPGKAYRDYYSDAEALALAQLVRELASPKSWSLLRHYFTEWLDILEANGRGLAAWPGQSKDTEVALLLSFPNSGTTFTLANTEKFSNATTAANYAQGLDACVPVRPDLIDGPFIHDLNLAVPPVVLTKTHCAGYCDDCNLSRSILTLESFERGCGSGKKRTGHKFANSFYPLTVPKKFVHLIRDPIDNIVSRMHHGVMRRREFLGWSSEQLLMYSHSREGIHQWCKLVDDGFWDETGIQAGWIPDATRDLMKGTPCAADFFRYTQWHNMAIELMSKLGLPTHTLHYEEYAKNFESTTETLFEFLNLEKSAQSSDFVKGKTYRDLFGPSEIESIQLLVQAVATEQSWALLKRYFSDEPTLANVPDRFPSSAPESKVVLLMSFPNSGTSYTITNLKEITQKATATNYDTEAMKFKPLFLGQTKGPYVKEPYYELPEYVLTKTHCDGYCDLCNQAATRQTIESFMAGCVSGTRLVNEVKEAVTYSSDLPKKAVHLIRSPFDNIVARMHLGIEKRRQGGWSESSLAQFNDTSAGLLAWCQHVDDRFRENRKRPLFTEDQKKVLAHLPCYAEWFRYVQWHNMAIQTIEHLGLPSLTMFYESYTTDFDTTVQNLLDFMELKAVKESKPFYTGKTYQSLFLPEHIQIASQAMQMLATEECWKLLQRYFADDTLNETAIS